MRIFSRDTLGRYSKLPFKFLYWLIGCIFFFCALGYLRFKKQKKRSFKQHNESVLCVSHVAISFDGRIKKCANLIVELGRPVVLLKPYDAHEDESFELSGLSPGVGIKRLGLSGSFAYFPCLFDFLMVVYMIFSKHKFIHCHDINTAFMGLLASKIRGKILISDLHEWKSETLNVDGSRQLSIQKRIFQLVEKFVVEESDFVITVNETIASSFEEKLKKKREIFIVKNCPVASALQPYNLKSKLNLPKDCLVGYYIGQMAPYRNLELIIQSIQYFPNIYLVFQGTINQEYLASLKNICKERDISRRVFFLPPIPHDLIPSSCQGADFGIFTCSTRSRSMNAALPNKLFEYIAGGIPIFSEDIPLMRDCIEKHDIGVIIQSDKIETIIAAFKCILEKNTLETMRKNVYSLRTKFINLTNKENKSIYEKIYQFQTRDTKG